MNKETFKKGLIGALVVANTVLASEPGDNTPEGSVGQVEVPSSFLGTYGPYILGSVVVVACLVGVYYYFFSEEK